MKKLYIALIIALASPSYANVLTQHSFEVRVHTAAGEVKVIVRAPSATMARALAEAQYGKERVKSVARK